MTLRFPIALAAVAAAILAGSAHSAPVPASAPLDDKALEALWTDLGSSDEPTWSRAMLRLASAPKETVPFLAARLRPAAGKLDKKQLDELVTGLESEKEVERTKAVAALVVLADNPAVRARLKEFADKADADAVVLAARILLKKPTGSLYPLQVKAGTITVTMPNPNAISVTEVLAGGGLSGRSSAGGPEAEHLKEVIKVAADPSREVTKDDMRGVTFRAVVVLAHVGSPEAVKALEDLAAGDEKSPLTQAAKDALKRAGTAEK